MLSNCTPHLTWNNSVFLITLCSFLYMILETHGTLTCFHMKESLVIFKGKVVNKWRVFCL